MTYEQIQQQLQTATDPNEIDFLYDQLFEIQYEAKGQQAEAFPGQPQRRK